MRRDAEKRKGKVIQDVIPMDDPNLDELLSDSDHLELDGFFETVDDDQVRREKAKARELRKSQWWKNEIARGVCHYCGRRVPPRELTLDHIVPLIRGGLTRKGNVVPCCKECNNNKKYMLPVEWAEHMSRLSAASSAGQAGVEVNVNGGKGDEIGTEGGDNRS
jgi:5-methylcytosine-specific restriction protein A